MIIQKLPWAGIHVQFDGTSIAIDPLFHFPTKFGQSNEPLYPLDEFGPVDAVFITHHHGDHFDPEAIALFYGSDIPVYMPAESLGIVSLGRLERVNGVTIGDTIQVGSLTGRPSYSVDGLGDPQVSWVIQGGDKKLIHCGDTLWHGYWWKIKETHGPIDVACLPVNAAVVEFPGLTPSGQPIVLSPEQAVAAATVLGVKTLVPIHYKAIHQPPIYRQTPDLLERLEANAAGKVDLAILQSKEILKLN
ncbi:MBL fold metallo-hydrolase [Paenibacillus sp. SI8]|uniref:MBL fold metallo-hydrolase n=1 Tax=unclassified Paenibacillus TaxID=185978 RepID=UPI0034654B76